MPSPPRQTDRSLAAVCGSGAAVVAWVPTGAHRERMLARALGDRMPVAFCRTEPALLAELARGAARVLVVELGTGAAPPPAAILAAVKRRFPDLHTVGYGWLGAATSAEVVAYTRAGLDAVALRGFDDVGQLVLRAIAEDGGVEAAVLHDLSSALAPELLDWARVVLERAREGPNVDLLARALACAPRTLQRVARQHSGRGPSELIESVRVLHAARLLASGQLSVDQVVGLTGYPSASALRRAMRRNQVAPPLGLRGAAAYAAARDSIVRRLRALSAADAEGDVGERPPRRPGAEELPRERGGEDTLPDEDRRAMA